MKAISFLGTGDYQEVLYTTGEIEHCTRFFPVALCKLFHPSKLIVLLTEAAKQKHGGGLSTELRALGQEFALVQIPEGAKETEIWDLFDSIAENFGEGERIILDVTHGYRSLPVLVTIAAVYLGVAKGARIEKMVYGAYEARDKTTNRAPVFDLTPFLDLLAWTTATDQFLQTGNALRLVKLLEQAQNLPYQSKAPVGELPTRLKTTATALRNVTEAIRTVRPEEAMQETVRLLKALADAAAEARRWAKPFGLLIERTRQEYERFALPDPKADIRANLRVQLDLLRWYIDKGQTVEAVILAREWLVSFTACLLDRDPIEDRQAVEDLLTTAAQSTYQEPQAAMPAEVAALPNGRRLAQVWDKVSDLRNDVAHVGARSQPRRSRGIITQVQEVFSWLSALAPDLTAGGAGDDRA